MALSHYKKKRKTRINCNKRKFKKKMILKFKKNDKSI